MTNPDSDSKSGRHGCVRMKSKAYAMKAVMRSSGERGRRQHVVEPVGEPLCVVGGGGGQHVVLAREVAVERAPRHPGRLGDLLHPEPAHAAPPDEAERRGEDPLLGGTEGILRRRPNGEARVDVLQCRGH